MPDGCSEEVVIIDTTFKQLLKVTVTITILIWVHY